MPGMRVAMMTREYPPEVYGGAGVHVTELVAQLRKLCQVDVHCQGSPRPARPRSITICLNSSSANRTDVWGSAAMRPSATLNSAIAAL